MRVHIDGRQPAVFCMRRSTCAGDGGRGGRHEQRRSFFLQGDYVPAATIIARQVWPSSRHLRIRVGGSNTSGAWFGIMPMSLGITHVPLTRRTWVDLRLFFLCLFGDSIGTISSWTKHIMLQLRAFCVSCKSSHQGGKSLRGLELRARGRLCQTKSACRRLVAASGLKRRKHNEIVMQSCSLFTHLKGPSRYRKPFSIRRVSA